MNMLRSIHESIRFMNRMHPNHEYYFIYGSDAFIARTHPIHESDRMKIILGLLYLVALYSSPQPYILAYKPCALAYTPGF